MRIKVTVSGGPSYGNSSAWVMCSYRRISGLICWKMYALVFVFAFIGCSQPPIPRSEVELAEIGMSTGEVEAVFSRKPERTLVLDNSADRVAEVYSVFVKEWEESWHGYTTYNSQTGASSIRETPQTKQLGEDFYLVFESEQLKYMGFLHDLKLETESTHGNRKSWLMVLKEQIVAAEQ